MDEATIYNSSHVFGFFSVFNPDAIKDLKLYKGGGNCHHYWLRQIYKTTIGESKTTKIEDADLIGYTKAKSEGFTAKKNNVLVAKPPKKMKNNGFLEPR